MDCNSVIPVKELLSSSIHTREASSVLMNLVEQDPCDHIELDFSSVEYISRAFADQFHVDKINFAINHKKTIIVSNATDEVISMLQVVAKTQTNRKNNFESIPVYKYSSKVEFDNFLLSF